MSPRELPPMPRDERIRTWLYMLLAVGVAYLLLVHFWFTAPMLEKGREIDALREQELALRLEMQQAPQLQALLRQIEIERRGRAGFMTEPSRELAVAALLQRLEQVVTTVSPNGATCQIAARTPSENAANDRYPRAQVQVRLRCGTAELAAVLHALESGSPRLFVDNLDVLARRSYLGPAQEPSPGALDVGFDLFGYLPGANPGARPAGSRP